jgi:hypothetical protein
MTIHDPQKLKRNDALRKSHTRSMKHATHPTQNQKAERHAIKAAKAIAKTAKAEAKAAAKAAAKEAKAAAKAAAKEAKAAAKEEASIQRRDPAFWKENPEADGRINTMTTLIRQMGFIKHERLLAQSLLVPYAEWLLTEEKMCRCTNCNGHKLNRWELMKLFLISIMD